MVILIALFLPRLLSVYLFFFSGWFLGVFETRLWPILGFVLMPYSMLWYTAVANWYGGHWGVLQVVIMVVAVMIDISADGGATN